MFSFGTNRGETKPSRNEPPIFMVHNQTINVIKAWEPLTQENGHTCSHLTPYQYTVFTTNDYGSRLPYTTANGQTVFLAPAPAAQLYALQNFGDVIQYTWKHGFELSGSTSGTPMALKEVLGGGHRAIMPL